MIPVSQLASPRVQAVSNNGFSLELYPCYALSVTKCSSLSITAGKRGCPSRYTAQQSPILCLAGCTSRTGLVSLQFPSPTNSNSNSFRRGKGRGMTNWRRGDSRSPLSSTDRASVVSVSATGAAEAAATSPDDSSSEEAPDSSWNSKLLSSISERLEKDVENSGEEESGGVQKTTTVLQPAGESETVVEEEYKLTDEGTLATVKVTRGGTTHRMNTKLARVLAEVGLQAESLQKQIKNFSVRQFIKDWGKKEPGLEDLKFNAAMYAPKEGVSNITQWTAMELTLQRAQMVRISRDALYLVVAFSFFGAVRILEAVVSVFASSPPNFWKLTEAMNAMDPLTVASLAHGLRQPIVGMVDVDPTNLEEVSRLKSKFWTELHKFYERQWKVVVQLFLYISLSGFVFVSESAGLILSFLLHVRCYLTELWIIMLRAFLLQRL